MSAHPDDVVRYLQQRIWTLRKQRPTTPEGRVSLKLVIAELEKQIAFVHHEYTNTGEAS